MNSPQTPEFIPLPEGWKRITQGRIQIGDAVWNPKQKGFIEVTQKVLDDLGFLDAVMADDCHCVIRRVPQTAYLGGRLVLEAGKIQAEYRRLQEELDRVKAQLPEGMKHCTIIFKECEKGHGWLTAENWIDPGCPTCVIRKLQAFKDWVHTYLDNNGVPHSPPGVHGEHGCRIGDRMDWLMNELQKYKEKANVQQQSQV